MDLVLKLRELRYLAGLTQREAARLSGVGEKTISSFESGARVDSLKISQLRRLLAAYGVSEEQFFGGAVEVTIAAQMPKSPEQDLVHVMNLVAKFPSHVRSSIARRFRDMAEAVAETIN